jgi:IclR family acetate operon transcriptional repressor
VPLRPEPLTAYTERTITDRGALEEELDRVRRAGYATAAGEREPHLNAIAAPVFGARDELAAIIGVQGPASRFGREAMRAALASLLPHAEAVSRELGFEP